MTYTPAHLQRWTRPRYYSGPDYPEYFPVVGQSRDSDTVERSNFRVALQRLGGESDTVRVIRDSHWAVGWVETLCVHESDTAALQCADAMRDKLDNRYPILSEDDWSELEWEEAAAYWGSMSLRERVTLCQECDVSVFAARRDVIPQDDTGRLWEALTVK